MSGEAMRDGERLIGPLAVLLWVALVAAGSLAAQDPAGERKLRQEEARDYFSKWLEQDVKYVISEEEREIFRKLGTREEKERFIEQFWARRDPDPRTAHNEFKEEHYRRIAYANDHFDAGIDGWRTDRGRIYIVFGPPDSIDRNPSGGAYDRPFHEGGGATAVFPFEIWRYRRLEGLGSDVEFEFVDKSYTGDYQLALSADEKDVFLNMAGHGMTLAEQIGMATRLQRLSMKGATRELYPMMRHRIKDSAFLRYETYSRAQAAPELKRPELREAVDVSISFDPLPVRLRLDHFLLNERQALIPLTLEIQNRDLAYRPAGPVQRADLAVYGRLTNLSGRVTNEFEDDLFSAFPADQLEQGRNRRTLFQKVVVVDRGTRYKLELVVKDLGSGNVGVVSRGVAPAASSVEALSASSLVLADYIEQLPEAPEQDAMFVLGDFKVRPSVSNTFPVGGTLGLYYQLYGAPLDQTTFSPSLQIEYRLLRGGQVVHESREDPDSPLQIYNDGRIVVAKGLPLTDLPPGRYQAEVRVRDLIGNESVDLKTPFRIEPD